MTVRAATGHAATGRAGAALTVAISLVAVLAVIVPDEPTWSSALRLNTTIAAVAWSAAGWAALGRTHARSFATLCLAGGALLAAAVAGGSGWFPGPVADRLGLLAALGVLPIALVEFPAPGPRVLRRFAIPVLGAIGAGAAMLEVATAVQPLELTMVCVVVGAVWWRFERAEQQERERLLWLVVSGGAVVVVMIPTSFLPSSPPVLLVQLVAQCFLPTGCAAGLLGPPSLDVRALVVRLAALATTFVAALATFAGLVAVAEQQVEPGTEVPPGVLGAAAVLVAAGFHPVRSALHGAFDRLVRGEPVDPLSAAVHVGSELSTADDPAGALAAVRASLGLPYVAVEAPDGAVRWSSGEAGGSSRTLDLRVSDRDVGRLVVGARPGESALRSADRRVLSMVVPTLALAVHARLLADDLAQSREQVVSAVENDRRRLRHELHDGLGPTLTGVAYAADAARNLLRSDPGTVDVLLADLRADTGHAIAEVRRIVDGLRPSSLDELGLTAALRQHATHLYTSGGERLEVRLDVEPLPTMSAATEVAVYRIVTEALTNVARHSGSRQVRVRVGVKDGALVLEVRDEGSASPPDSRGTNGTRWRPGVGLTSMRERAEQLGGSLVAGPQGSGGRVHVVIPLS